MTTPAAWYPDIESEYTQLRWWDGAVWTDHTLEMPEAPYIESEPEIEQETRAEFITRREALLLERESNPVPNSLQIDSQNMKSRFAGQAVIEKLLTYQRHAERDESGRPILNKEASGWWEGALGEIHVGAVLDTLPDGWHVFHSLQIGNSKTDIDHLIIGTGGVFTVNTKNYVGKTIWVADTMLRANFHNTWIMKNALREGTKMQAIIDENTSVIASVTPTVVFVEPKKIIIQEENYLVSVLDIKDYCSWLQAHPPQLSIEQVDELVSVLSRPSTWKAKDARLNPQAMSDFSVFIKEMELH